jgi:hypothetical protein
MTLRIITADERLAVVNTKTTVAIFGPAGAGKTSLARTLPPAESVVIDLEAGMKSLQGWGGDSIPVRTFKDAADVTCLVGGVDPAADANGFLSAAHYEHVSREYPDLARMLPSKRYVFVDSITDLTRQAMAWSKTRPEAFSERTGKPDTRGVAEMIERTLVAGVPFRWVAADTVYGVGNVLGVNANHWFASWGASRNVLPAPPRRSPRRSNHPTGGAYRLVREPKGHGCMTGASNWPISMATSLTVKARAYGHEAC